MERRQEIERRGSLRALMDAYGITEEDLALFPESLDVTECMRLVQAGISPASTAPWTGWPRGGVGALVRCGVPVEVAWSYPEELSGSVVAELWDSDRGPAWALKWYRHMPPPAHDEPVSLFAARFQPRTYLFPAEAAGVPPQFAWSGYAAGMLPSEVVRDFGLSALRHEQ